ncbi:Nitric oxide synthase, brain [Phytophthora pseudosyringae]|uniref:Nitric oxide synthase, brain n=1 Tax=Phytophthora pseudosyringae TaxID=221518 RepID=A0A8T1VX62_9STRA|nr:Nitric oxide synthase, brain [Phytophthora pseudosyringae]
MPSGEPVANEQSPEEKCERPSLPNWRASYTRTSHVDVFLGSLTFTSEQLASSLAEKAKQHGAVVTIQSLDEFKPEHYFDANASYRIAVFVVSTHAAGKAAPNAERFLLWLRKASNPFCSPTSGPPLVQVGGKSSTTMVKASTPTGRPSTIIDQSPRRLQVVPSQTTAEVNTRPQTLTQTLGLHWRLPFGDANSSKTANKSDGQLQGFQYAVFGVGNSIYRTCNATAKYIDTRLQELGAVRVCPLGLGDVSKGIDATFEKWEAPLLQRIGNPSNNPRIDSPPSVEELVQELPLHRASLPCAVSTNVIFGHNEAPKGEPAKRGPTFADIELASVEAAQHHGHRTHRRRYSSAATMIRARSFELNVPNSPVPPTDRGGKQCVE